MGAGLAYTTIMTIMTRLWAKGLVDREPQGRAFRYRPKVTEAELAAQRMRTQLEHAGDREAALSSFVGTLGKKDAQALRKIVQRLTDGR
jgi:predicted transcriptional regulator